MRNQLETLKTLFEQVRGLGIVMQSPQEHTRLSKNINLYFADDYSVTSVTFGDNYKNQVEIMKYSVRDNDYKVSFRINVTDDELNELIVTVQREFMDIKFAYLDSEIEKYRALSDVVELEKGEVVA